MYFFMGREREFRMLWEVRRGGARNLLAGTAHFFPYSFRRSLTRLIGEAETVLLEGPLDETHMDRVRTLGQAQGDGRSLLSFLDGPLVEEIKKVLAPPGGGTSETLAAYLRPAGPGDPGPLRETLELRPWLAFFTLWSSFLRLKGWKYSVDLEILSVANELGKPVHFLERIEEQVDAMEGIPPERIVLFLRRIEHWLKFSRRHAGLYLKGDLEAMLAMTGDYPTRCESIVEKRDPVLFARLKPFFEFGGALAGVGTTHIRGLEQMFAREGFTVTPFGRN